MKANNYWKVPVSYYYVGPGPLDSHQSLSIDLSPAGRDPAGEERRLRRRGEEEEEYIIINLRSGPRGYPHVSTWDSPSKVARTGAGAVASQLWAFGCLASAVPRLHPKHT